MKLKVPQQKRKAVVDADQRGNILGQFLNQPSAMPRRVQYLRGDGGGDTSVGGLSPSVIKTRRPFKLAVGV